MREHAIRIIETLKNNNFEAYMIGGSVRNTLHNSKHNDNLPIKDYDIVTSASYDEVSKLFSMVDTRGEQFKVAVVRIPFSHYEFEVAQYRGETYPEGGSLRPDKVIAVDTLIEDVQRRDFTINGIAEDEKGNIIDHVGGLKDIHLRRIRAIGDPNKRFAEDPLRMLRAFRFMAQLGYRMDRKTRLGIVENLQLLKKIPHERVKEEINKLLMGKYAMNALRLMRRMGVHEYSFYNSILKKEVTMFESVFDTSDFNIDILSKKMQRARNQKMSLVETYFIVYNQARGNKSAIEELNSTMFLNNDDIFTVSLMLKHHLIVYTQDAKSLLALVKEIGEQRGIEYLKNVLNSLSIIFDIKLTKLEKMIKKPLFKSQLQFNGEDVMNEGKNMGITKKGKWIGDAMDLMQQKTIMGEEFTLRDIVKEVTK